MKQKKNIVFPLFIAVLVLGGIYLLIRLIVAWVTPRPADLGVNNSMLKPCPSYPACVSSQAEASDTAHAIASIDNRLPVADARLLISQIMAQIGHASLIASTAEYLYFEIKVAPFGFKDDVEFYFPGDGAVIEVRSSARVPYYDFDVNRERVEAIRAAFLQAGL